MNTRKGFTLVELLVVIAILAILATVSVVGYTTFIERAERSNAETEAHQITTTIQSYTIAEMSYTLGTVTTGTGDDEVVTTYYITKEGKLYSITNEEDAVAATADAIPTTGFVWNTDISGLLVEGVSIKVDTNGDLVYVYGTEADEFVVILEDVA